MENSLTPNQSEFLLYVSQSGDIKVDVLLHDETVWLTQKGMQELFEKAKSTISEHIKNVFEEGELNEEVVVRDFRTTSPHGAIEGKTQENTVKYYNLDVIISVGYRVKSQRGTQFRIWATKVLREYIIKGFAMDDQRLKQGSALFGKDYFDELLERIREIRASERRFYQKITDIYAQCSIDYDPKAEITQTFYKTVQNKLHWAITGHTAAEIIKERANAAKPFMGLTTWKNAPQGKILKTDVSVAKNYLNEKEIRDLNRIVTMYLDFAELQAERQVPMKMTDWVARLDAFLQFNEYNVLKDAGKISATIAKQLAEKEYNKFRVVQDKNFESDFDKEVKRITKKGKNKK
ncbi:MAG: virulence RhuM family protein [Cytophagales bacterium]|uniref:virulence RhuM family protein n=1 Tax=Algoriphagus sp. CAU 1675 TaxID=3032597 RepID=UPI0023DC69E9|nr:virulence RhuM family protein [Algoriphagus sp. CAU 1675]MBR9774549.1 virulence RhuM family protein [Cytophagales bacterium]MDF2157885.1 virulence RhuM family protein [Algoriphagus sp. CAU 1675]|tara:strand:+ start:18401 stop:19444 length:1044 start_codon:yes stop_codon:yes gene_type:complete